MSLQKLKEQARQLTMSDRLELVGDIIESLRISPNPNLDKKNIIKQMKGLLKTNQTAPTDEEVEAMLEERRREKFEK